jgi:hypothetical protein
VALRRPDFLERYHGYPPAQPARPQADIGISDYGFFEKRGIAARVEEHAPEDDWSPVLIDLAHPAPIGLHTIRDVLSPQ